MHTRPVCSGDTAALMVALGIVILLLLVAPSARAWMRWLPVSKGAATQ